MSKLPSAFLEDDDFGLTGSSRRKKKKTEVVPLERAVRKSSQAVMDEIIGRTGRAEERSESDFQPTFSGSYYEHDWIFEYLGAFYDDGLITDVLSRVRGGKEATVYCCEAHPATGLELLAAKVYRPRMFRNLRNDARYGQGRELLDGRGRVINDRGLLRAIAYKTRIGEEAVHTSWIDHEYTAMQKLYTAGADVPRPVAQAHNTILMEFAGSGEVAAPTLHETRLSREEAAALFEQMAANLRIMLACGLIHGDFSAYNVLYWQGKPYIIDFPQVVSPGGNPEAYQIFSRDVLRICQYFTRCGVPCDPPALARHIWQESAPPGSPRQA